MTVTFSANLNDGGNGWEDTSTLEDLGIDPTGLSEEELQAEIIEAYDNWLASYNQGGWQLNRE